MLQHRVAGESEPAVDLQRVSLGLHAGKLDAVIGEVEADTVETAEEVEVPPGAAELAVGRHLEPDLLLFFDDPLDLAIFDRAQGIGGDLVALATRAGVLHRRRTQQAADVVGAERRRGSLHRTSSPSARSRQTLCFVCETSRGRPYAI